MKMNPDFDKLSNIEKAAYWVGVSEETRDAKLKVSYLSNALLYIILELKAK